jgi:hypothetical protein
MTNVLHWHKMTWVLVLWSGYIATWTVITGSGPANVTIWWLAGLVAFGLLWFRTQPLLRQGSGLHGLFVRPGWTHRRVIDLNRTNRGTEARRNAG